MYVHRAYLMFYFTDFQFEFLEWTSIRELWSFTCVKVIEECVVLSTAERVSWSDHSYFIHLNGIYVTEVHCGSIEMIYMLITGLLEERSDGDCLLIHIQ